MSQALLWSLAGVAFLERYHRTWEADEAPEEVLAAVEAGAFLGLLWHSGQYGPFFLEEFETFASRLARFLRLTPEYPVLLRQSVLSESEEEEEEAARPVPAGAMAAGAPVGRRGVGLGYALATGTFALVQRGAEWDEVCLAAPIGDGTSWVARTTSADGSAFICTAITPSFGTVLFPVIGAGPPAILRGPPPGVAAGDINWMCRVPQADHQWCYQPGDLAPLIAEGVQWAAILQAGRGPVGFVIFQPGPAPGVTAAALPTLPLPPFAAPLPGPGVAGVLVAAGGGAAAGPAAGLLPAAAVPGAGGVPPPAAAGGALGGAVPGGLMDLGMGGPPAVAGGDGAAGGLSLEALRKAVEDLQMMATSEPKPGKKKKKKKQDDSRGRSRDRKKSGKHKHKKSRSSTGGSRKKRKKKKTRDSSSSSGSRTSSSSSGSSSGSEIVKWTQSRSGGRKQVTARMLHAVEGHRFKKKGDVVQYAATHPGALSGYFLAQCFARLSKGAVSTQGDLNKVSVAQWASQHAGLSDIRDTREVATLACAMDAINRREVQQAMDILSQRILAIQLAKRKGGSWEKAEAVELIPGSSGLAASPMLSIGM